MLQDKNDLNTTEIRLIREIDITRNKDTLISLLEENFKINFQREDDLKKIASTSFENMLSFQKDGLAILIGAFKKETILGLIWAYQREVLGENKLHIGHFIVKSDVRFCGIGTKMLGMLESIATERGIKKIELMTTLENSNAIEFYCLNGYRKERVQLEKVLE